MFRFLKILLIAALAFAPASAQLLQTGVGGSASGASNIPAAFTFGVDYANGIAKGSPYPNTTTTRTTTNGIATAQDVNGNYIQFGNNISRITQGMGLWREEARTNGIRNNTMVGALPSADNIEHTSNGSFIGTSGSGWSTTGPGTVNFSVTGQATITGVGESIYQQISSLMVGRNYVVSIGSVNSFTVNIGTSPGASDIAAFGLIGNGTLSTVPDRSGFVAPASSIFISITGSSAAPKVITNVSLQDGERTENGNLTAPVGAPASQGVIQNGWTWSTANGGTTSLAAGVLTITNGTGVTNFNSLALPTQANTTYNLCETATGSPLVMRAGTTSGGLDLLSVTSTTGAQCNQFKATSATTFLTYISTTVSGVSTLSGISLQSTGAFPTNWTATSFPVGTTITVNGTVQTNGLTALSVTITGTNNSGGVAFPIITMEGSLTNAASQGQTWSVSANNQVSGVTSQSWGFHVVENNNGAFLGQSGSIALSASGPPFAPVSGSYTMVNNATNHTTITLGPTAALAIGATINQTLLIAAPQLELNPLINSTAGAAGPINNGGTGGTTGSGVYSVGGGTCSILPQLNVNVVGGAITSLGGFTNAGSCTLFPPSPAPLTYVSGVATGVTGATVTIAPTNNAAQGFSTTPILTNGAGVGVRGEDTPQITTPPSPIGPALGAFAKVSLFESPAGASQNVIDITDGSTVNRITMNRNPAQTVQLASTAASVNNNTAQGSGTTTIGIVAKLAYSFQVGTASTFMSLNGVSGAGANTAAAPTGLNVIGLGGRWTGTNQACNCAIAAIGLSPTIAPSVAAINAATTLP